MGFELPVPIAEQPDDNVMSGCGAQTKRRDRLGGSNAGSAYTEATFEADLPLLCDERNRPLMFLFFILAAHYRNAPALQRMRHIRIARSACTAAPPAFYIRRKHPPR